MRYNTTQEKAWVHWPCSGKLANLTGQAPNLPKRSLLHPLPKILFCCRSWITLPFLKFSLGTPILPNCGIMWYNDIWADIISGLIGMSMGTFTPHPLSKRPSSWSMPQMPQCQLTVLWMSGKTIFLWCYYPYRKTSI